MQCVHALQLPDRACLGVKHFRELPSTRMQRNLHTSRLGALNSSLALQLLQSS